MASWREVVEFPHRSILEIVKNRLLVLPQDPILYSGSVEQSKRRLTELLSDTHFPLLVDLAKDNEGKRAFFTAVAFFPQGFFGTFGMEVSESGQCTDVNIGLHVQGKNFTPEGLHILRYNSPHFEHSKKNSGAQSWHFDIIEEDGVAVRLTESDAVPEAISARLVRRVVHSCDRSPQIGEGSIL